jgi:hypothetical protein
MAYILEEEKEEEMINMSHHEGRDEYMTLSEYSTGSKQFMSSRIC